MILPIIAYGDSVLRRETEEIEEINDEVVKLIDNMFETMYNANGVGLAAPQIGKSLRLFIVDASPFAEDEPENEEEAKELEMLKDFKKVFINPIIEEETGNKWAFKEGCLSIPNIREEVYRKETIEVSYYNENFELVEETYSGYAARIIQHEYDHIEGVLFTDHINPLRRKLLKKKLNNISKGQISIHYKMRFPNA